MHLTLLFFCTTAVFSGVFTLRNGGPANCCLRLNQQQVHVTRIVSYWRQHKGICPIKAIVFSLENGVFLCSHPDIKWTKKAMRKVDDEAAQNKKHSSGLVPDDPQENRDGLLSVMLTLTSRWPQVPASVAMSTRKHGTVSHAKVKSSKLRRGPKKRIKKITKRRTGNNTVGKGNRMVTQQPLTSFATHAYK